MSKSKKTSSVNFLEGFRSMEERDAVRRHPSAKPATRPITSPAATAKELAPPVQISQQPSRRGKVALTHWVDPAVRKQLARLAIDHDTSQAALIAEALNLLFEKYGQPPIAAHMREDSALLPA